MTVAGISAVAAALPSVAAAPPATATAPASATAGASGASSTGFAGMLDHGLDSVQQLDSNADQMALKAATGDLTDVHDYTIAANEANLATQLTAAVRDKAVSAFNDVMHMQL